MKTRYNFITIAVFALIFNILYFASALLPYGNKVFAADLIAEAGPNREVAVNQQVAFDGSASTGSIVSYSWDFGDNSTSGAINPLHTFTSLGTFTVTLTVSDGVGGNSTDTQTVTVANIGPPIPPLNLTGYSGDNTVALKWDGNAESDLAGYNLYRSQATGGPFTKINGTVLTDTSYNDNAVSNGTPYYYVVTAEDISSYESGYSNEAAVTPASTGPTIVGGSLAGNNTWTLSAGPYLVTSDLTVIEGASLTIEPGVLIKFENGITMDIQGSFNVMGTAANPITFTSSAAEPQKSDWGGISYTFNTGGSFLMDYAIVEYGSYGIAYSADSGSLSPSITNSIIRQTGGIGIYINATGTASLTLTLENNEVNDNNGNGIYCYASGISVSLDSIVRNNQVYNNSGYYGIRLTNTGYTVLEDNIIYNNRYYGIDIYFASSVGLLTARGNTIYNHTKYGISWQLYTGDQSGVIENNEVYNSGTGIYVYVENTSTGVISRCVIVNNDVHDGTDGIRIRNDRVSAAPVVIYNSVYNHTGNGMYITSNLGVNLINYNNIYYNTGYGIYNFAAQAVDARLNWWGESVTSDMEAGGNPKDISAIYDIYDNGAKGMVDYAGWLSGEIIVSDLMSHITAPLDGDAVKPVVYMITGVAYAAAGIDKVEVSVDGGKTWKDAAGKDSWSYTWSIPGDGAYNIRSRVTDNDLVLESSGAGVNLTVDSSLPTTSGSLIGDETWSGTMDLTGDITVPVGVTLTLDPGTVIRFPAMYDDTAGGSYTSRTELIVNGSLIVQGISGSPITFTSNASEPQKNDWGGISYTHNAGGSFTMDWVIVEYGSYGIVYSADSGVLSLSITNSIIRQTGGDGISINATGTASLTLILENNEINDNDGYGIDAYVNGTSVNFDSIVRNNQVYNNVDDGISVSTSGAGYPILIEGNSIYNNRRGLYVRASSQSGDGSFTARGNTIYDNTTYGIHWNIINGVHSGLIENNEVDNSGTGIYVYNSDAMISKLGIVNNDVHDGTTGIRWYNATPVVIYNSVYNNTSYGMQSYSLAAILMNCNNIYNNAVYGIYNYSAPVVDARLNWWGESVTSDMEAGGNPKNIGAIYDIFDRDTNGVVRYDGWFSSFQNYDSDSVSNITNPIDNTVVLPGSYTISGIAYARQLVEKVEISFDGGTTWYQATTGAYSWSYKWNVTSDGVYSIKSRVTDKDGLIETEGSGITMTVDSFLPVITTSGTMTADENWSGVVNLTGDVFVPADVTLTIDPGTKIYFEVRNDDTESGLDPSRTELVIEGSFIALGTEAERITFTSSSVLPQKNDWGGIKYTRSGGGTFSMDYVVVEYGSFGIYYSADRGLRSPSITNSIIRQTGGTGIEIDAFGTVSLTLTLENNEIYDNDSSGIYCYTINSANNLYSIVRNNQVYNNVDYGIFLSTSAGYTHLIEGNNIYNNKWGLFIDSNNSLSGSGYTVRGNTIYENTTYGIHLNIYNNDHSELIIDNNEIYNSETGISVYNSGVGISNLVMVNNDVYDGTNGISVQGIALIMIYNSVYNNTNYGMDISNNFTLSASLINYNNIYNNAVYEIYNNAATALDARLNWWGTLVTSEMESGVNPKDISAIYDIYDDGTKGVVRYDRWLLSLRTLSDDPISSIIDPVDGSTLSPGVITIRGVAYAAAGINKVEVSTDGGSSWNEADGTYAWSYDWTTAGDGVYNIRTRVTDLNMLVETPGPGISLTLDSAVSITTSGALIANETWSGTVNLKGDVTVPAGITLTIDPGTVINFSALHDDTAGGSDTSRTELIVDGSLIVQGAAANPVTFTSNAVPSQRNDWGGINFTHNPGEVFIVDYALIEYGSYGIKYAASTGSHNASITNSTIRHTGEDGINIVTSGSRRVLFDISGNIIDDNTQFGIYADGSGDSDLLLSAVFNTISNNSYGLRLLTLTDPVVSNNDILNNSISGLNLSNNINARLNWWNDPSGPSGSGPGSGDSIDADVRYNPWLEEAGTPAYHFTDALAASTAFSQNGSATIFSVALSEPGDWAINIINSSGQPVRTIEGTGDTINYSWDGTDDGMLPLSDGTYTYKISALRSSDQLAAATVRGTIDLETALPVAKITSPLHSEVHVKGDIITITGTADSASYSLQYGIGENPSSWYDIKNGALPVIDGTLGTWDTTGRPGMSYTIRLTVTDTLNKVAETRVTINLLSAYYVSDSPDPFSPINGTTTINAVITMPVDWTITIKDPSDMVVETFNGSGRIINQTWDGKDELLQPFDDGIYTYELNGTEPISGLVLPQSSGTIMVDATSPTASFSSLTTGQIIAGDVDFDITGTAYDDNPDYYKVEYGAGASPTSWTLIDEGSYVTAGSLAVWETEHIANGDYTIRLIVIDSSGNETVFSVFITVDSIKITNVSVSATTISPLDSETSAISYDLDRDADVTVRIYDKDQILVRTIINGIPQLQGTNVVDWDGKDDFGAILPFEAYTYVIDASNAIGRSGVYNPEYFTGTVSIQGSIVTPDFEPHTGGVAEIIYDLVAPARVKLLIGLTTEATPRRTLIDYEPRDVDDNIEIWNGLDDNGALVEPSIYTVYGWATILPENVIITKYNGVKITNITADAFLIIPSYNQISSIYYTISANAGVTVKIYDPNGNYFRTLLTDVQMTAGINTVEWDGKDDSGNIISTVGAYSIEITAADNSGTGSETRRGTILVY